MGDELNEIISALISQLTSKLVGAGTRGLRGLSSPSSSNNNIQSFAQQMANSTSTAGYFSETPDTSVLDKPLPDDSGDWDCEVQIAIHGQDWFDDKVQDINNETGNPVDEIKKNYDCDPSGMHYKQSSAVPTDPDCRSYKREEILNAAVDLINASIYDGIKPEDLDEVITGMDCSPK